MSIECKCEPCHFDIRVLGYLTRKEDPAFEGTQCMWHEVIQGHRYCKDGSTSICVAGGTATKPVFALDNHGPMIHFGLDELPKYAKKIGAKQR